MVTNTDVMMEIWSTPNVNPFPQAPQDQTIYAQSVILYVNFQKQIGNPLQGEILQNKPHRDHIFKTTLLQ